MKRVLAKVSKWLWTGSRPPVPFELACACGKKAIGFRQKCHQVLRCEGCGGPLFVLPQTPLPPVTSAPDNGKPSVAPALTPAPVPPTRTVYPWRGPILAGSITFVAVVIALVLVLKYGMPGRGTQTGPAPTAEEVDRRLAAGRKAFAGGDYSLAAQELGSARKLLETNPRLLPAADARQLQQLYRQAALLADWPREHLEQVLKRAAKLNNEEWQAVVDRYKGRGVIFDVDLRRDATGEYHVTHRRPLAAETMRLDLANFKLLKPLSLNDPQRILFGAKLAGVRREADGTSIVTLEPDSGVLFTDAAAASFCSFQPVDDSLKEVLARQQTWAAELP